MKRLLPFIIGATLLLVSTAHATVFLESQIPRTWNLLSGNGLKIIGSNGLVYSATNGGAATFQVFAGGNVTMTGSLVVGSSVTFKSITSCSSLQTSSNGALSCGSGGAGTFGSGNVVSLTSRRYV